LSESIFIKIGGSFITDKTRPESLHAGHIRKLASAIRGAIRDASYQIVLAHGAGAYGHIKAKQYNAQKGIHPEYGWTAYYEIRKDMTRMNLEFVALCTESDLHPVTLQPSAIITAERGDVTKIDTSAIENLLKQDQIPLLHGDIVTDEHQGFTIASTEDILTILSQRHHFHRVIMISDVPGVLDKDGQLIPLIDPKNYQQVLGHLGGAKGADVTGGMRGKVDRLYALVRNGSVKSARIISGELDPDELRRVILNTSDAGTSIL
jgi:isopentenyl phosphate kinase